MAAKKDPAVDEPTVAPAEPAPAVPGSAATEAAIAAELAPVPHVDWPQDPTYEFILKVLRHEITVRMPDSEMMSRLIAEQALGAESSADVLSDAGVDGWENHIGRPYNVMGVRFGPSAFDEGCPVYATVDAVDAATGEAGVLTLGAWSPIYQLLKHWHEGWLPSLMVLTSKPTKGGMSVYRLAEPS